MSKYIIADNINTSASRIKSLIQLIDKNSVIIYSSFTEDLSGLIDSENPEAIFINLEFADHSGIRICKNIKSSSQHAHIPTLIYSFNSTSQPSFEAILDSNADAFFSDPINDLNFGVTLQTLLKTAKQLSNTSPSDEVQKSEERFKLLYENAPVGYQTMDENGYLVEVNDTWLKLLGYTRNEVVGSWFGDFMTPEHAELLRKELPVSQTTGKVSTEFELKKKNGSVITIHLEGQIELAANGISKQIHFILSDITERRKAEKLITDERILLKTLIDNVPDPIYVKDTEGRKLLSNKADLEILGYTSESSVIGKTDSELSYPGDSVQTYNDDISVISTGQPIRNKLEFFTDNQGKKRYFLTSKIPLINDSGEITGLVGVGHDITLQKENEQKINQLLKGIEQSPASIIITDIDGYIEYANSKFTEISGYRFDEVIGKNPRILQSGTTSAEEYERLWATIRSGNEYQTEIQNRKKNGELYWESIHISPIRNEEGTIVNFMAIKEDVSDRKRADLEILKLSVAIEQNPASVVITNIFGEIEYVNKKFTTDSGYSKKELIGRVLRIFKPGHTSNEVYSQIRNNLFAGEVWKGEHLNRTKNHETYWESVQISPIKNQEGVITNFVVLSENINDRKKMEKDLIAAKEKAEESDRLKSAFLANMSHEIRTPLNSILGFSDLLATPDLDPEVRKEFATLMNTSGNNLLAIINDILDISKIEAGQISLILNEFSVLSLISNIQKEYSFRANSKGIDLKLNPGNVTHGLLISSDESRIRQILINFVGNALKFTNSGYIEIGIKHIDSELQFYVKDTGIGIPEDYHDKIFDRFRQVETAQTRKYGGNGLGLAITKHLAELLGGRIWLESQPNTGSTFYFALPDELSVN